MLRRVDRPHSTSATARIRRPWARREHRVTRFRASVAPDNARSQNLIHKLGFVKIGEQWDEEDGLEWVFETPSPDSFTR